MFASLRCVATIADIPALTAIDSGFGYKKDDPSTWKTENLPVISEKGSESLETTSLTEG